VITEPRETGRPAEAWGLPGFRFLETAPIANAGDKELDRRADRP
jgi:hypothetical protein